MNTFFFFETIFLPLSLVSFHNVFLLPILWIIFLNFFITQHRCQKQVFVPTDTVTFLQNFQNLHLTSIFAKYNYFYKKFENIFIS